MDDLQEFAQRVFASQPFSRYLGAELIEATPERAELRLPIVDELKQQHGFVHGGAVSYLADNAITFAGGMALGGNALTSEFKISYLRPAVGEYLVARAQTRSTGRRQAVCDCAIYAVTGGSEKLCALALGTVVSAA